MKRIFALLMVICLLLSACSLGTTGDSEKSSDTSSDSGSSDDKATTTSTGEVSWDNAAWKNDTEPITFSCYIDYDWYTLDTWGKDHVSQEITKRTGVSLEVTKASDLTQLSVLLASGSLPDIIFTSNQTTRFEDPDICYPWDELIKEYVPEMLDLVDPVEIINNTAADGHFYTLKTHYANAEAWADERYVPSPGDAGLYLREDIMEKLGNPKIETMEDLYEVFQMVNEKKSELGIDVVYNPHPSWSNFIEECFGIRRSKAYINEKGEPNMTWADPRYKESFVFLNKLYREGLMYKEFIAVRPEDFFQLNRSGKVFAVTYNTGVANETNKIFDEQNIDGKFMPVTTALTVDGKELFAPIYDTIGWSSCFISKDCEDPGRAIKYMEFLKSPEGDHLTQWGIEGKHYTLTDDGYIVRTEEFNTYKPEETGVGPWYFQASGLSEGIVVTSGIKNPDKKMAEYAQTAVDLLKFRKEHYTQDPSLYFARVTSDDLSYDSFVKLTDEWTKRYASIIGADSEEECIKLYEETVEYFEKNGLDNIHADMKKNYDAVQDRYK